ncbi:uncharacterized protein LOC144706075 isoform X2 [Wolffia australiana]
MTVKPSRWETDPLLSAAEVVQDSADRMESLYRLLIHELDIASEDHSKVHKLPISLKFHKRNLVTALETTKWQLEDFERAVHAVTDQAASRGHYQFISALREQVLAMQKAVEDLPGEGVARSFQSTVHNESDTIEGLARFLSGDDPQNQIMANFFGSTGSGDEITEIEPVETLLEVNETDSRPLFFLENGYEREIDDHGIDDSIPESIHEGVKSTGHGGNSWCLSGALNRIWHLERYMHSRTFTKRRKDGEIADNSSARGKRPASLAVKLIEPLSKGWERLRGLPLRHSLFLLVAATLMGVLVFEWLV